MASDTRVMTAPRFEPLDVRAAYDEHADFVWRSLSRLGVREADLPDLLQECFVVVHRRRAEWDGRPLRGWLWGICLNLARNERRRARRAPLDVVREPVAAPDDALEAARARARAERMLARLEPEKRAVFVMFEVEGMSGKQIAETLGIALGTVHSRLHAARKQLATMLEESR